ncbi:Rpn family recombination-promoting nuclease/putative transposase [Clostridiales bacterium COT073_COT-073]|nr:Rpn family recombination-promoting nuclease/putative transposase [Clostridiales bacterium COT073_COT-073]
MEKQSKNDKSKSHVETDIGKTRAEKQEYLTDKGTMVSSKPVQTKNHTAGNTEKDIKKSKIKNGQELSQPHDLFFKANMGQKEVLIDFLESYLPAELQTLIRYQSLIPVEPKTISPTLKLGEADLLFRFQLQDLNCYLLLLMEHKSYEDKYTPIQILRYISEIWHHDLSQNQMLSPILPLVFHQGKKRWQYRQLKDSLPKELPAELLPYLPLYQALYYDFSWENAGVLKDNDLGMQLYLYLKTIISVYEPEEKAFKEQTLKIFQNMNQLEIDTLVEIATKIITYLGATRKGFSEEKIIELVKESGGEKTMESIFDRVEQRGERRGEKRGELRGIAIGKQEGISIGELRGITIGKQEGITIGEHREKLAFAVKMKRDGFPIEKIMEYTGLSREEIMDL